MIMRYYPVCLAGLLWTICAVDADAQPTPGVSATPTDAPAVQNFKRFLATGGIDRRPRALPDFFLPPGNRRSSEVGAVRVYKKDPDGKPLRPQPKDYPKTVDPKVFTPGSDEFVRVHEGFDVTSRDAEGKPAPLDFKAGVHGRVVEVGTGNSLGRIAVEVDERRNRVEYLHTSRTYVKVGDEVTPETVLGVTGKTGADAIHLHVQARNGKMEAVNPDEVVLYARKPPGDREVAEFFVPLKWNDVVPASTDVLKAEPLPQK
jgi:hypothetical protein